MHNRHISAWICLGLALGACDRAADISSEPDTVPDVNEPSVVETSLMEEVIALKARESDPVKVEVAVREILARHGHPLPPLPALPPAAEAPMPAAGALGKTAALYTPVYFTFRRVGIPPRAYSTVVTFDVRSGESFEARTSAPRGNFVDPSLVAFRRVGGNPQSPAFLTRTVAQNDDRSSSNWHPLIRWTNNSSSTREITLVVYASTVSLTGSLTLTIVYPDKSEIPIRAYAQAVPIYDYNLNPGRLGCLGPSRSKIELQRTQGRSYPASSLAFNKSTGRGGYLRVVPPSIYESLELEDILPSADGSFLLAFRPAVLTHDPLSEDLGYLNTQKNLFSCPVPIF